MKEQIKGDIEIAKTVIRVFVQADGKERAEVILIGKEGTEYSVEHEVYIHGEYHDVGYNIIATKK